MFSKYESAYRYMYEDQLVAAEDDYLEMFEGTLIPMTSTGLTLAARMPCVACSMSCTRTALTWLT